MIPMHSNRRHGSRLSRPIRRAWRRASAVSAATGRSRHPAALRTLPRRNSQSRSGQTSPCHSRTRRSADQVFPGGLEALSYDFTHLFHGMLRHNRHRTHEGQSANGAADPRPRLHIRMDGRSPVDPAQTDRAQGGGFLKRHKSTDLSWEYPTHQPSINPRRNGLFPIDGEFCGLEGLDGGRGRIEPVTPSMSKRCSPLSRLRLDRKIVEDQLLTQLTILS
jgi:hypothetical protein